MVHWLVSRPRTIETFLRLQNIRWAKPAGEIAGGGRIGNPLGFQAGERIFVLPPQFYVFELHSARPDVVGYVQDVIALVLGPLPQQLRDADAAATDGADSVGHFKAEVTGLEHQLRPTRLVPGCQRAIRCSRLWRRLRWLRFTCDDLWWVGLCS